jgi:hypothetical protein
VCLSVPKQSFVAVAGLEPRDRLRALLQWLSLDKNKTVSKTSDPAYRWTST